MYGPDLEGAYDAIFKKFNDTWQAGAPLVAGGSAPTVVWPDTPVDQQTQLSSGVVPWCRVAVRHMTRKVTTIGFGTMPNQGRVASQGTVMVNIFVPAGKRGLATAARLGKVALAAFEGQRAGDVWFTDAVPEEVGVDGPWFQYNVKATFHYDNHL